MLLDLSDFWVSSYDLKFLLLNNRWRHTGYHAFYTSSSTLMVQCTVKIYNGALHRYTLTPKYILSKLPQNNPY
jgi:hypothetical protein